MAFETLNPVASIWLGRGLRYLLIPGDLDENIKPGTEPGDAAIRRQMRRPPRPAPEPISERQSQPARRPAEWKPVSEAEWPAIWREQFERTRRGKVVWTYADLDSDLRSGRNPDPAELPAKAQARARRSQVLRSLIGALKYPQGTHTFWPCQLADEPSPDLFWSGARGLGSRGVIILGEECATRLLGTSQARPFTGRIFRGQKVVVLRALSDFSEADMELVVSFLRSSLAQIVR